MTNLEFIEKAIIYNQRNLEHNKKDLQYYKEQTTIINYSAKIWHLEQSINHLEETVLPHLHQIKAVLEAWEVVKPSIHHIKEQRCFVVHNLFRNKQYETIKKTLEVNE